jgi:hypothetical protein
MEQQTLEQDLQYYNTLLTLWQSENPIKTIKLQFLLASNALLLGFLYIGDNAGHLFFSLGAIILNLIWTLSIGRTSLFQKAWKIKLNDIAKQYPHDNRFQILDIKNAEARAPHWLRYFGKVSSQYYLVGAPIIFSLFWLYLTLSQPSPIKTTALTHL